MTNEQLYLQTMVKQHADASGAIVSLQKENDILREAIDAAIFQIENNEFEAAHKTLYEGTHHANLHKYFADKLK